MQNIAFISLALVVGGLVPIQGAINAGLGKSVNHPLQAALISIVGSLLLLLILLWVLRPALPSLTQLKATPGIYFTGGIYGVIFVTTILLLTPKIGIANTLVAAIVGQLVVSVVIDHFGFFGLARHPLNLPRIVGCLGLIVSLIFVQKS